MLTFIRCKGSIKRRCGTYGEGNYIQAAGIRHRQARHAVKREGKVRVTIYHWRQLYARPTTQWRTRAFTRSSSRFSTVSPLVQSLYRQLWKLYLTCCLFLWFSPTTIGYALPRFTHRDMCTTLSSPMPSARCAFVTVESLGWRLFRFYNFCSVIRTIFSMYLKKIANFYRSENMRNLFLLKSKLKIRVWTIKLFV